MSSIRSGRATGRRGALAWLGLALLALASSLTACPAPKACTTDATCAKGQICIEQACTPGCRTTEACSEGELCVELRCKAAICKTGARRSCYSADASTKGKGPCKEGVQYCIDDGASWSPCSGEILPSPEVCDQRDNDCDGKIDEEIQCTCPQVGQKRRCYTGPQKSAGRGSCVLGLQYCEKSNVWGPCLGQGLPQAEQCDQKDNDCNGLIDDVIDCKCPKVGDTRPCYTGPAGTQGKGICKGGTQYCLPSLVWGPCEGEIAPQPENYQECNGKDDDCDGQIDDANDCDRCESGKSEPCTTGGKGDTGECKAGTRTCDAKGKWGPCNGEILPQAEVCNGKDDDCDGQIDEELSCLSAPFENCTNATDDDGDGNKPADDPKCKPPAVTCFPTWEDTDAALSPFKVTHMAISGALGTQAAALGHWRLLIAGLDPNGSQTAIQLEEASGDVVSKDPRLRYSAPPVKMFQDLALSPSGEAFAVVTQDPATGLQVFRLKPGTGTWAPTTLKIPKGSFLSAAFTPDNLALFTTTTDKGYIWLLKDLGLPCPSGSECSQDVRCNSVDAKKICTWYRDPFATSPDVRRLQISPQGGGRWLAGIRKVDANNHALLLWDIAKFRHGALASPSSYSLSPTGEIGGFSFRPGGGAVDTLAVSGLQQAQIDLVELPKATKSQDLWGAASGNRGIAHNPTGLYVASGGRDGILRIWERSNSDPIAFLYGHPGAVGQVLWAPSGNALLTTDHSGLDGNVRFYRCPKACAPDRFRQRLESADKGHISLLRVAHRSNTTTVAMVRIGGRQIRLWEPNHDTKNPVADRQIPGQSKIQDIALNVAGDLLFAVTEDGVLHAFRGDIHTDSQKVEYFSWSGIFTQAPAGASYHLAIDGLGQAVAVTQVRSTSGSSQSQLAVQVFSDGDLKTKTWFSLFPKGKSDVIVKVALTGLGSIMAVASQGGKIEFFGRKPGTSEYKPAGSAIQDIVLAQEKLATFAFLPSTRGIVIGTESGRLYVFDRLENNPAFQPRGGQGKGIWRAGVGSIEQLAFSPNGRYLAVRGKKQGPQGLYQVQLWNAVDFALQKQLELKSTPLQIAYHPKGGSLLVSEGPQAHIANCNP